LNADFRKFESSQKDESRAQSADSSKACKRPKVLFGYHRLTIRYVCVRAHRSAALQVATKGVARGGQGAMPPYNF